MCVTKYHLSRFPPVKQMSRYWSVHTTLRKSLVLNFLWLSRNSNTALIPGLYHISLKEDHADVEAVRVSGCPAATCVTQDTRDYLTSQTNLHAQKGHTALLKEHSHLSNLWATQKQTLRKTAARSVAEPSLLQLKWPRSSAQQWHLTCHSSTTLHSQNFSSFPWNSQSVVKKTFVMQILIIWFGNLNKKHKSKVFTT